MGGCDEVAVLAHVSVRPGCSSPKGARVEGVRATEVVARPTLCREDRAVRSPEEWPVDLRRSPAKGTGVIFDPVRGLDTLGWGDGQRPLGEW